MKEQGKRTLRRAIEQMPAYWAPDRVWSEIEQVLEAEEGTGEADPAFVESHCELVQANRRAAVQQNEAVLRRAVRELPRYQPQEAVFGQIVGSAGDTGSHRWKLRYWAAGIAASVALLVTLTWLSRPVGESERIEVSYSEETIYTPEGMDSATPSNERTELLRFIEANCRPAALPCETPEFKGLLAQYRELQAAKTELESQIQAHREQPQLVHYLVRVEKQQTEVGKRLIQYLRI
jgi:hypothetical protein